MVNAKEEAGKLEWRINVGDGNTNKTLEPETGLIRRVLLCVKGFVERLVMKIWRILKTGWTIGVNEPKKVINGMKVGLALTIVSMFYYTRPLYDGFGNNGMWAIMTVVVVFDSNAGATCYKGLNRVAATFLAGLLGMAIHWIAYQSGDKFELVILGISVFLFGSATSFSRFIPSIKATFDYGAMIFILTFALVTVSSYRVDKLMDLAQQRLSTIVIGSFLCIVVSMVFWPIWAGDELHRLVHRNLEKLADSLNGCVTEYFKDQKTSMVTKDTCSEKMRGYKCVLNSKGAEDSLANFARWEPAHGRFGFRHPWKQYLKIGASIRRSACCIETLNSCANADTQAPTHLKQHMQDACMKLSSISSTILKELATTMKRLTKSSKIDILVVELNFAVKELQNALKLMPYQVIAVPEDVKPEQDSKPTAVPLLEVIPLATLVSLLIDNAVRIQEIVHVVDELAVLADFRPEPETK